MCEWEVARCRSVTVALTIASIPAMFAAALVGGFRIDILSFAPLFWLVSLFGFASLLGRWRSLPRLRDSAEASALGLAMTLPVLVFSYAAMRPALPLADTSLIAADRALGFDWVGLIQWIDRYPLLAQALALGYSSFSFQLMFLPILLAALGLRVRAFQMIAGYLLVCTIAISISTFFPAVGAYEGHGLDGRELKHLNAHFGYFFLESFNAVRSDPHFVLSIGSAAGIITFPSIHAGIAALCAWAAWPSRLLRGPFLLLNMLMAASALANGSHYLVDVIAGLAVAATSIMIVARMTRTRASEPSTAAPAFA